MNMGLYTQEYLQRWPSVRDGLPLAFCNRLLSPVLVCFKIEPVTLPAILMIILNKKQTSGFYSKSKKKKPKQLSKNISGLYSIFQSVHYVMLIKG